MSGAGASRIRAKRPEFLRCLKRGGGLFPTPRRSLRGHFPASEACEPFEEQFNRADVRSREAFTRRRAPGDEGEGPGPGRAGPVGGLTGPRAAKEPSPLPRRGRGCGRTTRKRRAPGAGGARAARAPRTAVGAGAGGARSGGGRSCTGRAAASPPSLSPSQVRPSPSSPPPSESRALL